MQGKGAPGPVLVLDGEWESALAVVRSLGRHGIKIDVASSKPFPLASLSTYCRHSYRYPDPLTEVRGFRDSIRHRVRAGHYALVIPVTDASICPLMDVRAEIERYCPVAMAANSAVAAAQSKDQVYELAKKHSVPFPRSHWVGNLEDYRELRRALGFPVVVKPDRSKVWVTEKNGRSLSTAYALTVEELDVHAAELLEYGPIVLQEYIRGEVVGLGVLAHDGEILFSFQFRSLHEVPLTGGISSYRVSEAVDTCLASYASTLLSALSWDGIAHVEFIREASTGKWYLMEINGRLWASLPLAVAAGADFPLFLYQSLVKGRREFPPFYKVGLRARQLSREREWVKEVLFRRSRGRGGLVAYPDPDAVRKDILRLFRPDEPIDSFDSRDPLPGVYDCLKAIGATAGDLGRFMRRVLTPGQ